MPGIRRIQKGSGLATLGTAAGGLVAGFIGQEQRQLEQQKTRQEAMIKNKAATLKLVVDEFGKDSPQASRLRLEMIRMQDGGPDLFATPDQGQIGPIPGIPQQDFSGAAASQAGRTASTQRNLERQRAFQTSKARAKGTVVGRTENGPRPSAGDVAFARRQRDKFRKEIATARGQIDQIRRTEGLASGEKPPTPSGFGKAGKQITLDNFNRAQRQLAIAERSLDSLMTESQKRGIDLEFGDVRTPGQGTQMPVKIQTATDFNALPSGSLFIDPDTGETKKKP